ncbi:ribosomal protein S17 [Necator americanus]|nr:ribosomal protein S17 [Necator americanus]ETN78129.1 ribosomal protein S17 [Necator americanus]
MAEQVERAFLKQPTINLNNKARLLAGNKKVPRYVRNIGLGFKTPREASEGTYIDKKCPWTGNCSIRGNILTGVVLKNKMTRTIVVRRDYLHFVKKYRRFEKRHKNVPAHCSPAFR